MHHKLVAFLLIISAPFFSLGRTEGEQPGRSVGAGVVGVANSVIAKQKTQEIKVYLVALSDDGKKGRKIGCGDSLVAVTRTIKATPAPLKAAIEALLAMPREFNRELGNYWQGEKLKVKSASIRQGTATIYITGTGPYVAGVCDEPRIMSQIEETAKQFSTVKRVKVFVNGEALSEAIR